MAFTADSNAFRTFDNDRKYELFRVRGGPDGIEDWKIIHSDGQAVFFSTVWEPEFIEEWRRQHPTTDNPVIRLVRPLRGMFPDLDREESDAIIVEALQAFKGFHGKPSDSHVAVYFEPLRSPQANQNWWMAIFED